MNSTNDTLTLPDGFFRDENYVPAKQSFLLGCTPGLVEMADELPGPDRADLASDLIGDLMDMVALTEQCRFTAPAAYERLPELRAAQATLSQWL